MQASRLLVLAPCAFLGIRAFDRPDGELLGLDAERTRVEGLWGAGVNAEARARGGFQVFQSVLRLAAGSCAQVLATQGS